MSPFAYSLPLWTFLIPLIIPQNAYGFIDCQLGFLVYLHANTKLDHEIPATLSTPRRRTVHKRSRMQVHAQAALSPWHGLFDNLKANGW